MLLQILQTDFSPPAKTISSAGNKNQLLCFQHSNINFFQLNRILGKGAIAQKPLPGPCSMPWVRDATEAAAHGTAFGGGVGRTFGELCGALSGGLIAIGHLHGRRQCGGDWDFPAALGAELRQRFFDQFGTSRCAVLRERFGPERQMDECRKIVRGTVEMLLTQLTDDQEHDNHLKS